MRIIMCGFGFRIQQQQQQLVPKLFGIDWKQILAAKVNRH
jgi:hypothetical protein